MKSVLIASSFIVLCVVCGLAGGEAIVFQDGLVNAFYTDGSGDWDEVYYQGTEDNYLNSNGYPRAFNFGQNIYMTAGNTDYERTQHGILKFDVSCIGGMVINAATLEIWSKGCGYPEQSIDIHGILPANSEWHEGSQTASDGQPGDSTWGLKTVTVGGTEGTQQGVPWAGGAGVQIAGVDYDATVIATVTRTDNTNPTFQGWTFELPAALVQSWADYPDDNAGLLFKTPVEPSLSMVNFLSSDYDQDQAQSVMRPKLTIDYSTATGFYTISGSAGIDGVTMTGLPGNPVTSGGGLYSATVYEGWSGTVVPTLAFHTFALPQKVYSNVAGDQLNEDYVATPVYAPVSPGPVCVEDGVCEGTENQCNCPADCADYPVSGEVKAMIDTTWANRKNEFINMIKTKF